MAQVPAYKSLQAFSAAVDVLRMVDDQMPSQQMAVLMAVALRPGITMQQLGDMVGISQSSCSRNVGALGEWHRKGIPGHGLVEAIEDPIERRRKVMFLTGKGRTIVGKLLQALTGETAPFNSPTAKEYLAGHRSRS